MAVAAGIAALMAVGATAQAAAPSKAKTAPASRAAAKQTTAAPSPALMARLDPVLQRRVAAAGKKALAPVGVIVRWNDPAAAAAPPSDKQLAAIGGTDIRRMDILHTAALRIPAGSLLKLAALPGVAHVSYDMKVGKTDDFTVPHSEADIASNPVSSGGYGLTGQGIGVAVLDSGVNSVKDLNDQPYSGQTRVVAAVSMNKVFNTQDGLGHGTHVAGIIAGNGQSSTGSQYFRTFYGVARRANIVSVRVLDDQGNGQVSDVLAGIAWILVNKSLYNIRVLNISLGHDVTEPASMDPLDKAVEIAWKSGIVVVCSAGNEGRVQNTADSSLDNEGYGTNPGTILVPGNDPYVITVGAMKKGSDGSRPNDRIATYSSRGPARLDMILKPDIVAPGNQVISLCVPNGTLEQECGSSNDVPMSAYATSGGADASKRYFVLSGTSMAAPVVSGAAALLLQKNPLLSPDTVKARLMLSADKWAFPDGTTDPFTFGSGLVNIPAALQSKATVPLLTYATSPSVNAASDGVVYLNLQSTLSSLLGGLGGLFGGGGSSSGIWGLGITDFGTLYGTRAIWGNNAVVDNRAIWGNGGGVGDNRAIWGNGGVGDNRAIWGNGGGVNDNRAIWGNTSSVQENRAIWGNAMTGSVDTSSTALYGEQ